MTVSKAAAVDATRASRAARKEAVDEIVGDPSIQLGELAELLGYSLKRAQLKIFEDFLRSWHPCN